MDLMTEKEQAELVLAAMATCRACGHRASEHVTSISIYTKSVYRFCVHAHPGGCICHEAVGGAVEAIWPRRIK